MTPHPTDARLGVVTSNGGPAQIQTLPLLALLVTIETRTAGKKLGTANRPARLRSAVLGGQPALGSVLLEHSCWLLLDSRPARRPCGLLPDPEEGPRRYFRTFAHNCWEAFMTLETLTMSTCDLATRYSELQQLRNQVEEAEKRQAIILASDSRRKLSRAVQDLAAF